MERTVKVTCRHCKKEGLIVVIAHRDGTYEAKKDLIKHKRGCELRPKQPNHFKNRKSWQRGERRGNALVGARETAVSGALNKDADGRVLNHWRVETKTTKKDSYRMKKDLWEKLHDGAIASSEEPIFYVETATSKFVLIRDALGATTTNLSEKTLRGKSFEMSKELALMLNDGSGQYLADWAGKPIVILSRFFNPGDSYERNSN